MTFDYFALCRKSDGREVYSSPDFRRDGSDVFDLEKISVRLKFYFDRVNSGREKSGEEKLKYDDYVVKYVEFRGLGYARKCLWTKECRDFLKDE